MSFSQEVAIAARNLGKVYEIYESPRKRLTQALFGSSKRKYYREFYALSDISFEVNKGASMGIIGRNGAGKSTLLQLITGTMTPSSGVIQVNGKVAAVLELGAGFNLEFSGRDNIELYCNLFQMSSKLIEERFSQIVAFSELEKFIDQPLKTYSSGMMARLAFSVIAHVDADILIIDEALSVGDAAFSQKCMRFLHDFRDRGTIFFVSHDISAVKAFCDEAIWLDGGRVRARGDSKTVCEAYMSDIYPNQGARIDGITRPSRPIANKLPADANGLSSISTPDSVPVVAERQKIRSFGFNAKSSYFGTGEAEIIAVDFFDEEERPLNYCEGALPVTVRIRAVAHIDIQKPILGFSIKDRLGQPLLGGNTYLSYESSPPAVAAGNIIEATFCFRLPTLLVGDYAITAAIADGCLEAHTQLHWLHDAVLFKVVASSMDGVLVGVPLDSIAMKVYSGAPA